MLYEYKILYPGDEAMQSKYTHWLRWLVFMKLHGNELPERINFSAQEQNPNGDMEITVSFELFSYTPTAAELLELKALANNPLLWREPSGITQLVFNIDPVIITQLIKTEFPTKKMYYIGKQNTLRLISFSALTDANKTAIANAIKNLFRWE